ncbi:hypothetical protein ID866_10265 [Astraeus odoratus]|nr:hypothetical protein ID866_10265 [Astraeus odoratus]
MERQGQLTLLQLRLSRSNAKNFWKGLHYKITSILMRHHPSPCF